MQRSSAAQTFAIRTVIVVYFIILLTLVLLAASNYPVQWRAEVNRERERYLEVVAQAIEYYRLDHDDALFTMPSEPAVISNQSGCSFACPALGRTLACVNLQEFLVPGYMRELPRDPLLVSSADSGFYLAYRDGLLRLGACHKFFRPLLEVSKSL